MKKESELIFIKDLYSGWSNKRFGETHLYLSKKYQWVPPLYVPDVCGGHGQTIEFEYENEVSVEFRDGGNKTRKEKLALLRKLLEMAEEEENNIKEKK